MEQHPLTTLARKTPLAPLNLLSENIFYPKTLSLVFSCAYLDLDFFNFYFCHI